MVWVPFLKEYWPVVGCVAWYTFLLFWFIYRGDYVYAWYWFAAGQITIASMLMAGR